MATNTCVKKVLAILAAGHRKYNHVLHSQGKDWIREVRMQLIMVLQNGLFQSTARN